MKNTLSCIALAASSLFFASTSIAQTVASSDQLYQAFGEKAGLVVLMDDFMERLVTDARTAPYFKAANQQRIKAQLVEQLCALAGGPCVYSGADMKSSHLSLGIKKSDFHALVEVLQHSMDAKGIAFYKQNEMLALLAPMNRDIITVK